MMRLLRATILVSTLSLLLFAGVSPSVLRAQATPPTTGTVSPYAVYPTCGPANDKKEMTCTYPNGQPAICRDETNLINTLSGVKVMSCKNPDGSTGKCEAATFAGQGGAQSLAQCSVTNANGTSGGEVTTSVGTAGVSTTTEDSLGNRETAAEDTSGGKCGMLDVACAVLKIPGLILSGVAYAILVLSTFMLFLAGTVFNWVVIRTVFQFATYFGTSEGMIVAWTVLRDIANIGLLFGFVFIGVATILNTQIVEGYSAKKALPRLIIFAVLLNFSLFATQGIIDVANGFASIFSTYAGEQCGKAGADGASGQQNEDCANVGISGKIMSSAGMNHMFSTDGMSGAFEKPYSTAAMLIILSIFVSITAMVLFAASIMLVIRVVVLSLLMVTSPIGFAGLAIPSLNKIAKDWWSQLINQAFFAPLYLLMVFISLKLVDGLNTGGASLPQALSADVSNGGTIAGNMQVVVVYAVVIGFMVGSLMVAQKLGAAGAGFATKTAGGLAFGAQGFVARRTVGRLSGAVANSKTLSRFAEKNPGLGRLAYAGLNKGATASFSARNLVGGALGGAGVKLDIGKANKTVAHGYHGIEEKAEKERLEFAKKFDDIEETNAEHRERLATMPTRYDKTAKDLEQSTGAANSAREQKTAAEAAVAQAVTLRTAAEENLRGRQIALDTQKEVAAANPTDVAAQAALREEEANVVRASGELRASEENVARTNQDLAISNSTLSEALKGLASAKDARKKLEAEPQGMMTIKGRDRQIAHAESMERENNRGMGVALNVISAGGHSNHKAAAKILKDANKSDVEKALDTLKKSYKDESKKESEAAPVHSPAAPSGPAPAAGDHH